MELKAGMTLFFLNETTYNPNDDKELIVECEVKEVDGKLGVVQKESKEDWMRISFMLEEIKNGVQLEDFLFYTRGSAREAYNNKLNGEIAKFNAKSKEELLQSLFRNYFGDSIYDMKYFNAVKEKIEKEFRVKL